MRYAIRARWAGAAALLALFAAGAVRAEQPPLSAQALVQQALAAQGGEALLRSVRSIGWRASGYRNALEQSERPEGPYITEFNELVELHDAAGGAWRQLETRMAPFPASTATLVLAGPAGMALRGGAPVPASPAQVQQERERLALSPERVLLSAQAAPDLKREADTVLHGVPHQVLAFSLDGAPVHVLLNAHSHLPSAVDYAGPLARAGYWAFLGDAVQRTTYSFWQQDASGLRFPMQWNVQTNGLEDRLWMLRELRVNAALDEQLFAIPPEVQAKYATAEAAFRAGGAPQRPLGQAEPELVPGVTLISGAWNVSLVLQDEGVLIIEAPISSGYSAQVIAEARKRYPGKPIVGVVSTSDSWPHLAGVREYVAQGIPVYALDLNEPILRRLLATPYTSKPDALQRAPRAPQLHLVHDQLALGSGANRVLLVPLRGMTSERQLMVYFPQHQLLYGSDPFQKSEDGSYFTPQTVSELVQAVAREQLAVRRFYMMHMGPTPWAELQQLPGKAW
jgi:hypothetical protein